MNRLVLESFSITKWLMCVCVCIENKVTKKTIDNLEINQFIKFLFIDIHIYFKLNHSFHNSNDDDYKVYRERVTLEYHYWFSCICVQRKQRKLVTFLGLVNQKNKTKKKNKCHQFVSLLCVCVCDELNMSYYCLVF